MAQVAAHSAHVRPMLNYNRTSLSTNVDSKHPLHSLVALTESMKMLAILALDSLHLISEKKLQPTGDQTSSLRLRNYE